MADPPLAEKEVEQVVQCIADFFLHHRMPHFLRAFIECKDQRVTETFRKALTADPALHLKFLLHQARKDVEILQSLPDENEGNAQLSAEVVEALQRVHRDAPEIPLPANKDWEDFAQAVAALKVVTRPQEAVVPCQKLDGWLCSTLDALAKPQLDELPRWSAMHTVCLGPPSVDANLRRCHFLPRNASGGKPSGKATTVSAEGQSGKGHSPPHPAALPQRSPGDDAHSESGRMLRKRTLHHLSADEMVATPPPTEQQSKRRPWSAEEDGLLRAAVKRVGAGHWADICRSNAVLQRRGQVAVKDRWRILSLS
eukprot:GGOE01001331.1.p1 GENE.GGOE01001331.1~~GGOE01001331.1.p1  ORF type:complete len:311 (-),score=60.75 GGOE01001331.1:89-1021(-)